MYLNFNIFNNEVFEFAADRKKSDGTWEVREFDNSI